MPSIHARSSSSRSLSALAISVGDRLFWVAASATGCALLLAPAPAADGAAGLCLGNGALGPRHRLEQLGERIRSRRILDDYPALAGPITDMVAIE